MAPLLLLAGCGGAGGADATAADGAASATITSNQTGTDGGYYYSFWSNGQGSVSMNLDGSNGYSVNWSNVGDFTAGKGWNPGSNHTVTYTGSYSNSGGGAFGIYGWTTNPLVEYYIVEAPGSSGSPAQGTQVGTLTSDGATYTIWKHQQVNQPCITGNSCTFWQYISMRQSPRTSGTITIANHFAAWANAGLSLGSHNYQILLTESWNGSGSSSAKISVGSSSTCSAAPSAPTGLTATATSSSQINLSWSGVTPPSGCTVTYNVLRNGTQIATGLTGTSYSNTGLAASTAYQYAVQAVDSAGASANSSTVSATTQASSNPPPTGNVSINVGGAAVGTFVADTGFSGGSTYTNSNTIDTSQITSNAPPASVFQSERYGSFTYTVGGLTAGSAQTVILYFAETYFSAAGQRSFGVSINGTSALSAFDIYAAAGGQNKAIARSFNTTASSSGQVVITFTNGSVNNAKVNGITVAAGSVTPPPNTYALTVSETGSGTVSGSGISCGSTCTASYTAGTAVTLTATPGSNATFSGWAGACSGTTTTCVVTMNAAQSVSATFTGSSTGGPCANPVTFTNQSGNFNTTGAVCLRTATTVNGWGCSNFDGRTVSVNGGSAASSCGGGPLPLAKSADGYTYFSITAGTYPWASLYTW